MKVIQTGSINWGKYIILRFLKGLFMSYLQSMKPFKILLLMANHGLKLEEVFLYFQDSIYLDLRLLALLTKKKWYQDQIPKNNKRN